MDEANQDDVSYPNPDMSSTKANILDDYEPFRWQLLKKMKQVMSGIRFAKLKISTAFPQLAAFSPLYISL